MSHKKLSVFIVAMMNVVIVANLQMMTATATYGYALLFFYLIAALTFFLPCILLVAELSTAHPITGGSYVWVEKAYGKKWGFFAVTILWLSNVIWYPTIFSLIATISAYLIAPDLANNAMYTLGGALTLFWGVTLLNMFGIRISSLISTISALAGVILPTLILIFFGLLWIGQGKASQISFSNLDFSLGNYAHWAFLMQVIISLVGIEMAAVHAGDILNAKKNIPKALAVSSLFILAIVVLAPLSIALVIPSKQIAIVSGMVDAIKIFFNSFQLSPAIFLFMVALVFIGNIGSTTAWMISVTRGMHVASINCAMPHFFQKTNRYHAPLGILILEGIVFTVSCSLFFFSTVSNAYWILLALASQISLIYYILIFAAAAKLKKQSPPGSFKIPGGVKGTTIAAAVAGAVSLLAIVLGFFPPSEGAVTWHWGYPVILAAGIALSVCIPFLLLKLRRQKAG